MFSVKSGHLANKILIDANYLYCSTVRSDSLDSQIQLDHIQSRFKVALEKYDYLLEIGKTKYRMDVFNFIMQVKKQNNSDWIKHFLIPTIKTMKFKDISIDLFLKFKDKTKHLFIDERYITD